MNNETILVNLDEPLYAPRVNMTLLDMVKSGGFFWPQGATCVTQECDGELTWWSAPVRQVSEARMKAALDVGLMPLLGLKHQVDADYFCVNDQAYVSKDWEQAVVTFDQFVTAKGEGGR
ncbi:hypothetical protein OKT24_18340 [Aeromonas veronii]|nr:hypothetical protein [Aeromonas veronii]